MWGVESITLGLNLTLGFAIAMFNFLAPHTSNCSTISVWTSLLESCHSMTVSPSVLGLVFMPAPQRGSCSTLLPGTGCKLMLLISQDLLTCWYGSDSWERVLSPVIVLLHLRKVLCGCISWKRLFHTSCTNHPPPPCHARGSVIIPRHFPKISIETKALKFLSLCLSFGFKLVIVPWCQLSNALSFIVEKVGGKAWDKADVMKWFERGIILRVW